MKSRFAAFCMALLFHTGGGSLMAATLVNGNFEAGLAGWTRAGEVGTPLATAAVAAEGTGLGLWLPSYRSGHAGTLYQDVGVVPGEELMLGARFLREVNARLSELKLRLEFRDASGAALGSAVTDLTATLNALTPGFWVPYSVSGTAPAGATTVRVQVSYIAALPLSGEFGADASVFVDNFAFGPLPIPVTGGNAIIGKDDFDYAAGAVAGRAGGVNWCFDNTTNNNPFIGHTASGKSTWDALTGTPVVSGGKLTTTGTRAAREYGFPTETEGAINDADSSAFKAVYYRVRMTRGSGVTWSRISSHDLNQVPILHFGVPDAGGAPRFAIEQGGTTTLSGMTAVTGQTYTLVCKLDFTNDLLALYVNPDFSQPESAQTPVVTRSYTFGSWSAAVALGSGGTGTVSWDELAVGTSWSSLQQAYPLDLPVTGPDVVVAEERFEGAGGGITGRDEGFGWDFKNNASGFVGHTQVPSAWQNYGPYVDGERQMLGSWDTSCWRNFGPLPDCAFSNASTAQYKQIYFRCEMMRSSGGVTSSGVSVMDDSAERVSFGVAAAENQATQRREFAIRNVATGVHAYTGIPPIIGARHTIVGKVDFAAGTCALFVDPDLSLAAEPPAHATLPWSGGSGTGIRFGSAGIAPTWFDNVAVTTSWNALRGLFPAPQAVGGDDILVGADGFAYPDGSVHGKAGGAHWDYENRSPGDGTANYTGQPSRWKVRGGAPAITAGRLSTTAAMVQRVFNGNEADGAFNKESGTVKRRLYCRVKMSSAGFGTAQARGGLSLCEYGEARVFLGVPNILNSSNKYGIAIQNLLSNETKFSTTAVNAATTYELAAKLDYDTATVSLWINPNWTLVESANPPAATLPYNALNSITAIRLASEGSGAVMWDDAAVGTSWRSIQTPLSAPKAVNDAVTLRHQGKVRLDVRANDVGTGAVAITVPPASGSASVDVDGRISYRHTAGTPGADSLKYTLTGPGGVSAAATVAFTFNNAMRLPNVTSVIPLAAPSTGLGVPEALPGVGFTAPDALARIPGRSTAVVIGERGGQIFLVPDINATAPVKQLLLDVAALVNPRNDEDFEDDKNELGLKGVAFHPNFASNRQFFVTYCLRIQDARYVRLSRFTTLSANPDVGDVTSEQPLITQPNAGATHNIGDVAFGPDGYLYFCAGDESNENSQRIDNGFWSAIFRIDVDKKPGSLAPHVHSSIARDGGGQAFYSIPPNNPFVGATSFNGITLADPARVRTEIYALGFRNPWQLSFDSLTGEIYCCDVGDDSWEEINLVTPGGNYGWPYREGNAQGRWTNPPPGFNDIPPLWTYPHEGSFISGHSATCGVVYRGTRFPDLNGKLIFTDFITGHLLALKRNDASPATVERIGGEAGIAAIDYDPTNGDVLLLDYGDGRLRRLAAQTLGDGFPQRLSDTGLVADMQDLTPNPGIEPYNVNLPFWSDHARKERWFMLPGAATYTWAQDGPWGLPAGGLWVKNFTLDATRGNPATAKRLETRVLMKTAGGSYGVSYKWNDAGTEAYLVEDAGMDFDREVNVAGVPTTQRWRIPSRAECLACHTPKGGHALSWVTRQLHHDGTLAGRSGEYIDLLRDAGYASGVPANTASLPQYVLPTDSTHTLEARARAWLAVNCAYCHQAGGTGLAQFDLRPELTLFDTKMIDGMINNRLQHSHRAIVLGSAVDSVILLRTAGAGGYSRMPPMATRELDLDGIGVLIAWISGLSPAHWPSYQAWRVAHFGGDNTPEGAPTHDADLDGSSNYQEYLEGTLPLNGSSRPSIGIMSHSGGITITVPNVKGRRVWIETSTDLVNWNLWNVPGNDGNSHPDGAFLLNGPHEDVRRFFRKVSEEK